MNSWGALSSMFWLTAARTVPVVWLLPAFGGVRISPAIRLALGAMIAALCLPIVLPLATPAGGLGKTASMAWLSGHANSSPASAITFRWILSAARELLVGTSIGICASLTFRAAELAGNLAGLSLGTGHLDTGARVGDLYLLLCVVIFMEVGGLELLARALVRSFEAIPLGAAEPSGSPPLRGLAESVVFMTAKLWESALVLAAPILISSWLATMAVAALGRLAPELGAGSIWLPVRAWLGVAILFLGLGVFEHDRFQPWLSSRWELVNTAIELWRRR